MIISKDLSRIGRHNARTLLFIEDIKSMGKRLIAIDDDYDTEKDNDDIIGIKTWYNERYVKDLSKKIRSNIHSYMRNNDYINALPYGYIKENDKIIIDESVKHVIEKIFSLYLEGNGVYKIAKYLNDNNIPNPSDHKKLIAEQNGKIYKQQSFGKWLDSSVINILKNDFYTGTRRLGTTKRDGIHGKIKQTKEKDQFVFHNNHEAIIDKNTFDVVQEQIEKRKLLNYRGDVKHKNPYSGFLFCSDCGKLMISRSQKGRIKCYVCGTYKRYGKETCTSHHIREEDLDIAIKDHIAQIRDMIEDFLINLKCDTLNRLNNQNNYDNAIKKLQADLNNLRNEHKVLLMQKIKAITKSPSMEHVIEEQYEELEKDLIKKLEIIDSQINQFEVLKSKTEVIDKEAENAKTLIDKILKENSISKKYLALLVDKIIVGEDKKIIVELKSNLDALFYTRRETSQEQVNMLYSSAISHLSIHSKT